ncbi:hypothetical protein FRC03_012471 [Tulasnella sp. 419]|nr:hypothetical protein FRC03_012471 [Tulasnella sp. 419]
MSDLSHRRVTATKKRKTEESQAPHPFKRPRYECERHIPPPLIQNTRSTHAPSLQKLALLRAIHSPTLSHARSRIFKPSSSTARRKARSFSPSPPRASSLPPDFGSLHSNQQHLWLPPPETVQMMTPTTPPTPTHTLPDKSQEVDSSSSSTAASPTPSESTTTTNSMSFPPFPSTTSSTTFAIRSPSIRPTVPSPTSSSTPSSSSPTPTSSPTPNVPAFPYVPPIYPLITRETLRELDLEVILRSPQLRHDLLFDPGLQFRPTSGRRKRDLTEKYWESVTREIEFGCVCTSFDERGRIYPCVCGKVPSSYVPSGLIKPSSFSVFPGFVGALKSTPSRILPLLVTLKEVLACVIQPSTPSSAAAASSDSLPIIPPASPSSSFADPVLSTFDPHLISQELKHNVLNSHSLFLWLSEILKSHCAPMRDTLVESMVQHSLHRSPVKALRMCFELLEVMKLDVANHQLQALRPYLMDTSAEFEMRIFQERYEKGIGAGTGVEVARRWIGRSLEEAKKSENPSGSLMMKALSVGMVELVFNPPYHSQPSVPSPSGHSRSKTAPASPNSDSSSSSWGGAYPETLYLDHTRLNSYVNDSSDLLGLYMVIMLFRQLVSSSPTGVEDWEVDRVKREVWEVGPSRLGMCFDANWVEDDEGSVTRKWKKGMGDVVLQVAVRADQVRSRTTSPPSTPPPTEANAPNLGIIAANAAPSKETLSLVESWLRSNYNRNSPLYKIMKARLRKAVLDVVFKNVLAANTIAPTASSTSTPTKGGTGLEPLMPEIIHLGERIARLVKYHARVYRRLYEVEGFVLGASTTSSVRA